LNRGDRTEELVGRARAILFSTDADKLDGSALWRAYVSIEYAILDLKLRYGLEGEAPPKKLSRKAVVDIAAIKSMVVALDVSSDKKKLLYDLRTCRDMLKAAVAGHERRSTTS
jgi:hypothetical protein